MANGFVYDAGDPSVGIFGGEWEHVSCPEETADEPVLDQTIAVVRYTPVLLRTYHLLTCTTCATQAIVTEDDYSPDDATMDAMEAAEREAFEAMVATADTGA